MTTERVPKRKPFGDLYNELILTRDELAERELFGTVCPGETELVRTMYEWQVVFGNDRITCETETEARYLQIFAELGWRSVMVPADEKYLAHLLPEFESLKNRADELYKKREKTIFSKKLRREVKNKFYRLISQSTPEHSSKQGAAA